MLRRLFDFTFGIFLVLLPIQTIWFWREPMIDGIKWQYGTIGLYGTDILLLSAILLYILLGLDRNPVSFFANHIFSGLRIRRHSRAGKFGMTNLLLPLFVFWAGLSVVWADDKILAGYLFAKLLLATSAFYLVRTIDVFRFRKVLGFVLVFAVLESALGVYQFLSQSSFASTLLGMSNYDSWRAGVSVLKNESGRWLRAYGAFPHPNMFGVYIGVIFSALVAGLVFFGRKTVLQNRFNFIVVSMSCVTIFLGLIVSFSRAAWLGVVFGFISLSVSMVLRGNHQQRYCLAKVAGVIGISAIIFTSVLHDTVFPRFDSLTIQKETSVTDRTLLAKQATEIIEEHPVFGVGAGNYTLAVMKKYPEITVWDVQPVHNIFLLIFAELGAVGIVFFLMFLGVVFVRGFKSLLLENKKENMIFFIALLSLTPSLFLDHFLWDSHFGLFLLFLLQGLVMRKSNT